MIDLTLIRVDRAIASSCAAIVAAQDPRVVAAATTLRSRSPKWTEGRSNEE